MSEFNMLTDMSISMLRVVDMLEWRWRFGCLERDFSKWSSVAVYNMRNNLQ